MSLEVKSVYIMLCVMISGKTYTRGVVALHEGRHMRHGQRHLVVIC